MPLDGTNLVAHDTDGAFDVFLRDTKVGTTTLVSAGPDGHPTGGDSSKVSADGTFVAFGYPLDDSENTYLWEKVTCAVTLVSKGIDGGPPDGASYPTGISADGRFVVIDSGATTSSRMTLTASIPSTSSWWIDCSGRQSR